MIDINEFDAIRIGLASSKQIRDWSSGEVTKPETINYRTLKPERDGLFCERIFGPTKDWECYCGKYKRVRYKGIICERCGVEVTRQKVRRERMGHIDLAAPVSHIWFFKGVPSRIGYLLDIAPRELEKVLYFAASIVTNVDNEARAKDLNGLEDKVKSESEQIYVDRDEQLADLEKRLARRRAFFAEGKEKGFDEDDDFWTRGLATWAEEQLLPPLEDARKLVGGLFLELVPQITTEDAKKIRELVRNAAIRDDRKLTPRELENVAVAAEQILAAILPLEKDLEKATGAKKGAITKHIHRIVDALLTGEETHEDDQSYVANVDVKNLDKVRDLGNGILKDAVDTWEEGQDIRELTNDLCLRTDGKIQKEDLDSLIQWALKVREMYLDIESRREDTREAAVDSVRRLEQTWQLFRDLEPKMVVNDEQLFRELKDRFGSPYGFGVYFRGGMGAESIRDLLRDLDLNLEAATLRDTIKTSKGQKQQRAIKRLKVVSAFIKSQNRPEWMILEAIPVIPPELRPMVQLDGGRFATSDLNDLYRRVINRNNRLKRLLDLGAPEIIVNNEKRMLQEAVDALFDNGRRGRAVTGPGNRPLKSLSDMLKGKQGRFRQNLLGKRVDYSGRSVIVAGPTLKLHQCGLPKLMALELFKPFIMSRLVERKSVQNIKAAKKYVDSMTPEVWDVLEEVIAEHPVLLNRAPTLHRLGIQAFEPILVEGKAIQVHPLVCHAFNADFDGDQMAVHLPLSAEAQAEARILMLSSNNILSPASGRPLATPTQDMVLGIYYLTYSNLDLASMESSKLKPHPRRFDSADEIEVALEMKAVGLQEPIEFRFNEELHLTTPGRVLINSAVYRALDELLPPDEELEFDFMNRTLAKADTDRYVLSLSDRYGAHTLAPVLDTIKTLGFKYATKAGVTISKNDIVIPPDKEKILAGYEKRVEEVHGQYDMGLITEDERHETIVNIWTEATDEVATAMEHHFDELNPVFMMANSGCPRLDEADPPARRHARADGQSEGRDHRAPDQGQLHGRPVGARVLHLDARRPQGPRRHRPPHRGLGLPDAASRRRLAGRDRPRGRLRHRRPHRASDPHERRSQQVAARPRGLGGHLQAARDRQAGQAAPRRAWRHRDARAARGARGRAGAGLPHPRPLGAEVPRGDRGLQDLLRHLPGHGRDVRDRRRGRHHRRPVDRRAGHAADDAHVPHRRCRRRGHHARPAARRRDLRGAEPEGRGHPGRARRAHRDRADRTRPEDLGQPDRGGQGRRARRSRRVPAAAADAAPRHERADRRARRSAERGLAEPGRQAGAQGLDRDRAVPRRRGAEGLQEPGRRDPRQAHRADRPADAEEGPGGVERRHRPAARPARRQGDLRARERQGEGEG